MEATPSSAAKKSFLIISVSMSRKGAAGPKHRQPGGQSFACFF
jgi:hypothetical protein